MRPVFLFSNMFKDYPNRKLNRIKGYDYSHDGFYFVTICVKNRANYFGRVMNQEMILNLFGKTVKNCWFDLPKHYGNCRLDELIIMPNHLHGIVEINNHVGTDFKSVPTNKKYSLSTIIQGFKIFSSRRINLLNPPILFRWHRSFYDHIIRDDESLYRIRKYIRENPLKWEFDRNKLENLYL